MDDSEKKPESKPAESPTGSNDSNSPGQAAIDKMAERKSLVRVLVTYGAALFLFFGGGLFILFLIWTGQRADALNLFGTILPVSAAVISFWFAGRTRSAP